jgi:hypothetical protein
MTTILAFITGVALTLSILALRRPVRPARLSIRTVSPLSDDDIARIFREWHRDDDTQEATLHWLQAKLDEAQGEVIAHKADPHKLASAAGAAAFVEYMLTDLAQRLAKPGTE